MLYSDIPTNGPTPYFFDILPFLVNVKGPGVVNGVRQPSGAPLSKRYALPFEQSMGAGNIEQRSRLVENRPEVRLRSVTSFAGTDALQSPPGDAQLRTLARPSEEFGSTTDAEP